MSTSAHLLSLPPEIRDQIWALVFKDLHVDPFKGACNLNTECAACFWLQRPTITTHSSAIAPLLACKQIYNEARTLCYNDLSVHISSYTALSTMHVSSSRNTNLNNSIRRLTLYTHLEAESRFEWFAELFALSNIFPNLDKLTVNSHMRPPKTYDSLIDAAYLLGPLLHLPAKIRPSGSRAQIDPPKQAQIPDQSTDSLAQAEQDTDKTSQFNGYHSEPTQKHEELPMYATRDLNANFEINFKYNVDEILFDSPFIGAISTNDAIEEHEAVLRDCLADDEFRSMAEARDLNGMTMALLEIAREHEQIWLQGLHRRRLGTDFIETEIMGEADGDNEFTFDLDENGMSNVDGNWPEGSIQDEH